MGCGCGSKDKEFQVTYGDGKVEKFATETEANFAVTRSGKGGTVTPVAKS